LKRDYGFTFANIFDTMIAARILDWKRYGLAAILEERFGVRVDKRLQRYNWGVRPLPTAALEYARSDAHYLPPLRELQLRELQIHGKLAEAQRVFAREACAEPVIKRFDAEGFWRIPGVWQLDPVGRAVLRELYILRDNLAREMDWPPFKVISNATMVQLAIDRPSNQRGLERIRGLSQHICRHYADKLLDAITRARHAPMPSPPRAVQPPYS
ncbi:MAG: HRDC domain-containing protein, partial [Anaerolineae bacterium]